MSDETSLLKNLQIRVKSFEYLNYTLGVLFLLMVVSPSLGLMFGASSMALGLLLVISLCFITVLSVLPFSAISENVQSISKALTIILAFVFFHGLINYFSHIEQFNITRFLLSFLYLILFIMGTFSFVQIVRRTSIKKTNFVLYFSFISFVVIALLSFIGFSPFQIGGKPMVFYSEPSHYALDFLPLLLFIVIQVNQKNKIICLVVAFEIALSVQNLTLMIGIILVSVIALRVGILLITMGLYLIIYYADPFVHSFLSFLNPYSEFVMAHENVNTYLSNRLPISEPISGSINGSFLVYVSGWERAYLNLLDYVGFGVGFQQLGFIGKEGMAMERILDIYKKPMGLYAGGSVAPKFLSEFGVFALLFIGIYVAVFFKTIKKLRSISIDKLYVKDLRNTFFMCCFVIYAVSLFIRGTGYFSYSSFLFVASIFWLFTSNKKVSSV